MRRAGVSLPPEAIWLGESWEDTRRSRGPGERTSGDWTRSEWVANGQTRGEPATDVRAESEWTTKPGEPATDVRAPGERGRGAPPERRTVTIRGRGAERDLTWTAHQRRRPARPVHERHGFKPDRAAMWAVLLGLLLVLVAATSSHAAVRARILCLPHRATHCAPNPAAHAADHAARPPAAHPAADPAVHAARRAHVLSARPPAVSSSCAQPGSAVQQRA
jgi:hypothetical protein